MRAERTPKPVLTGRYRYSKWRWRVLVCAVDGLGTVLMRGWRALRKCAPLEPPGRILLVQLDHLGDGVLTTPMIPRLRAAYPDARIDVLASSSNREVFEADPDITHVHVADRNWFERRPAGWALGSAVWRLGRSLRRHHYDLGIDVRGDILSIAVIALAGIRTRVGWAMGGGAFLLTHVAEWTSGQHEVRSRLRLLECLGIRPGDEQAPRVRVHVTDQDRAAVARRLRTDHPQRGSEQTDRLSPARRMRLAPTSTQRAAVSTRPKTAASQPAAASIDDAESLHAGRFGADAPLLAVHLGAGTPAKRWPLTHWRVLIRRFLEAGWRVVVVGGPHESGLQLKMEDPMLLDWNGLLSVTQTTALLERADLFLGADSGPAHLAAAAGVPSVVLFSGTNRVSQWRPWSRRSLVLKQRVTCQPCHRKVCPLADHPCLSQLRPEHVYHAAQRWWARLHQRESPHAPI